MLAQQPVHAHAPRSMLRRGQRRPKIAPQAIGRHLPIGFLGLVHERRHPDFRKEQLSEGGRGGV